ncbi:hypothetical protein BGP82_00495 [Pseudomonas putida]|uniref:RHS protein conserved region domain-containing protein n=1 Tax=Pseudomonas putida TaxID=303 RepID=A0A2S3XBW9_PSEPU|nr:hypothetical protein BGP83_13555 [Pseudomonas putida]POG12977.1 hypothetical protein BGP82_00495 [Pseudomonas putida]
MYVSGRLEGTGQYRYDSLGRRVAKRAEINGEVEQKRFLWQGIANAARRDAWAEHLYLYEPGSYGRWRGLIRLKGEGQKVYYFHTDQVGTPLELTDSNGKIVWQATYRSWGAIETLSIKQVRPESELTKAVQ